MTNPTVPPDDFDAAKAVFEKLKDLPPDRQERVLRWVAEGLGFANPVSLRVQPTAQTPAEIGTPIPGPPGNARSSSFGAAPRQTDIKSFVAEKNPRSDIQFATTVAYYYRFEAPPAQRRDTIDSDCLQEAARLTARARFAKPRNILSNAKAQGYLDSAARGEYSLNTVGENLVAMALPSSEKAVVPRARARGGAKRTSPKPKTRK
jgi:hypothetical protein